MAASAPERAFILLRFAFCRLLKVLSRSVRGSVTPARSPRQRPGQNRDAPTDHVFAGGLRSLLDSARESYPDTARGSRTRLFQSVYPRSALVAQCRLRWFVNPACRGAEQIVSWGPSSMLSVLPASYPVSSISNERTMFDLPDLHAGHVRQFFFFLIGGDCLVFHLPPSSWEARRASHRS